MAFASGVEFLPIIKSAKVRLLEVKKVICCLGIPSSPKSFTPKTRCPVSAVDFFSIFLDLLLGGVLF